MGMMDIEELVEALQAVSSSVKGDPEALHGRFDDLLMAYIDDERVTKIYEEEILWYG